MRRTTRLLVTGTVLLALALGGLYGGVLADLGPAGTPQRVPGLDADTVLSGFGRDGGTAATVARLEGQLRAEGNDPARLSQLGLAYQVRWRETGNAAFLPLSERALRRVLASRPKDAIATLALGNLALIRHDFRGALVLGREAHRRAPFAARPYGVLGDALLELGRYRLAFATFDRMAALKPNASSYSRVSYARELRGDVAGAIASMELALDASIGRPEATAWTAVELGKLHWSVGRIAASASHYRYALQVVPGYVPALDALARVEAARGRTGRAIALQRRASEAIPLPGYVAQLGDLLAATGKGAAAREQYALVGSIERLQVANGVKVDLETALYRVDHGIRLHETLALARRAHAERPSVLGDDVLAWALARNGRCGEALVHSKRSLRLGTRDAAFFFHRGMIERCLGRPIAARAWFTRALVLNPHFSVLWSPTARRYAS